MIHESSRARLAQLRSLRSLRVLHGGATGLEDPFGTSLLSDGAKIWSVGADGIDGGGSSTWESLKTDIVPEIPAK